MSIVQRSGTILRAALLLPCILAVIAGCGGGGGGGGSVMVPSVHVSVNPATDTVSIDGTRTFVASVTGTSNSTVTWSILEGPTTGSISSTGVYVAPGTPGTYHIIATSSADPTVQTSAVETVQSGSGSATIK